MSPTDVLRAFFTTHRAPSLLSLAGVGILLGVLLALRACQAQPASPERATAPTPAAAPVAALVPPPTLSWKYADPNPDHFVIRRSLDGGTWQDVGLVPDGSLRTWQDTSLPTSSALPLVAQYVIYAVASSGAWSETSNRAIATFGGAPRRPKETVAVVRADSAETQAAQYPAKFAGDGDPATMWHTKYSGTPAPLPHWIVLDLGAVMPVDGLAYLPRQDGQANGRIVAYEVAVSQDNAAWSAPVVTGAWAWYEKPLEQYARWPVVEARYVRLKALSEASGGPWTAAAEIALYAGKAAPVGVALGECVVTRPEEKITIVTCRQP